MPISIPATLTIDDESVAMLLAALGRAPAAVVGSADASELDVEIPSTWRELERREGESYAWPQGEDRYDPFTVYEGTTSKGTIHLAIGRCDRANVWGRDREYLITFHITAGGKQPLCEFLETDDASEPRTMIAIVRGNGPSQRGMYDPGAVLPGAYRMLRTGVYRDHIRASRSWNKQAVLAAEDDIDTMLAHSLIQADHRFDIRPS